MDFEAKRRRALASASGKKTRLGLMGGTFNPIHYGHLLIAEQVRCEFKLNEVIFIPSKHPPHKKSRGIADAEHRYLMTVLATSTNPYFSVSRIELDRKGPSYAIDTIRQFRDACGGRGAELYFITGFDAVLEIITWRDPVEILRLCTIISASRPGYDVEKLRRMLTPRLLKKIVISEAAALAISSTDIRRRIRNALPVKYLLPDSVERYIFKNRLYTDDEDAQPL
ncbi:MAG: nicotinate-nucleotide adenylyltransferase [bacterium]